MTAMQTVSVPTEKGEPMADTLAIDAAKARKAGLSYGKWKATQPVVNAPKRKTSDKVRTCEYCGKEIFDKYNRNRKYCDDNCRSNAWYKRVYVDEKKEKKCEYCGKMFAYIREKARYCSASCSAAAYYYRKKEEV